MTNQQQNYNLLNYFIILFVGLKLTEHIDWSWFQVLIPFYMKLSLVLINQYRKKPND